MANAVTAHDDGVPHAPGQQYNRLCLPVAAHRRLRAYRRAVTQALPGLVEDVVLFGSRARNTARRGSDYDVAVILSEYPAKDQMAIRQILADAAYDYVVAGTAISPIPVEREFLRSNSPLASEIARDGISIP